MATKKEIENQKELNALQRLTISMVKDMDKAMDDVAKTSDKRNKLLQNDANLTKGILKDLEKTGNVEKAIARIKQQESQSSKKNYGTNSELAKVYQAQLIGIRGIAEGQKEAAIAAKGVFDVADEVGSKFNGLLTSVDDFVKKIPIIGPAISNAFKPLKEKGELAISRATDGMKNGFIRQFTRAKKAGDSFATSFSKGISGGMKGAQGAIAGTLGISTAAVAALAATVLVAVAAIYLIGKAIKIGLERFKELDAAAKSFRNETGLLNSQTQGLQENIRAVNTEFANLGVSAEDVSKAASDFTNEFGGLEQPTQSILGSMVMLNKNFGIGTQEASKLNKVFQNIGGLTAAQSQYLVGQTAEMAKMAGVAPQKVIKDMADSSEYAYKYFQGSPEQLAKAAVQAAKLGTSIAEAGKAADNLLDFQNSITKELEASAILGVNINLGQARYLAANGDILGSQQAILDQVAGIGDLTKLNVYEQQALVEATGMEFDSLVNQQRIRERFGKLSEEQLKAATSLLDAGKDINSISQADLKAQSDKLALQEGMQSQMDKLQNGTKALKTGFSDMFQPMIAFFIPILNDVVDILSSTLLPIFKVIGSVARIIFGVLGAVMNVVMAIVKPLFAIGGAIMSALFEPINQVASALQPLFDKFGEFKDKVMQAIQPVMGVIKSMGEVIGTVVGGAIGFLVDILVGMFNIVFDIFSAIGGFIYNYLISPIMSFVNAIKGVFSSIGSFFGFGGEETANDGAVATSDSINDGVVQNGQVVSTNPADFLLATKDPQGLAEDLSAGGGMSIDMSTTNALLSELKEAFLSNKDVYMDKVLVTSTVTDTQERSGRQNRFGIQGA